MFGRKCSHFLIWLRNYRSPSFRAHCFHNIAIALRSTNTSNSPLGYMTWHCLSWLLIFLFYFFYFGPLAIHSPFSNYLLTVNYSPGTRCLLRSGQIVSFLVKFYLTNPKRNGGWWWKEKWKLGFLCLDWQLSGYLEECLHCIVHLGTYSFIVVP